MVTKQQLKLYHAIMSGDYELASTMLYSKKVDLNFMVGGMTLLHHVAVNVGTMGVQLLLQHGMPANIQDEYGATSMDAINAAIDVDGLEPDQYKPIMHLLNGGDMAGQLHEIILS